MLQLFFSIEMTIIKSLSLALGIRVSDDQRLFPKQLQATTRLPSPTAAQRSGSKSPNMRAGANPTHASPKWPKQKRVTNLL